MNEIFTFYSLIRVLHRDYKYIVILARMFLVYRLTVDTLYHNFYYKSKDFLIFFFDILDCRELLHFIILSYCLLFVKRFFNFLFGKCSNILHIRDYRILYIYNHNMRVSRLCLNILYDYIVPIEYQYRRRKGIERQIVF